MLPMIAASLIAPRKRAAHVGAGASTFQCAQVVGVVVLSAVSQSLSASRAATQESTAGRRSTSSASSCARSLNAR